MLKPGGGHEKFYGKGVLLESRYYQLNKSMLQTFTVNYSDVDVTCFLLHCVVTQKVVVPTWKISSLNVLRYGH